MSTISVTDAGPDGGDADGGFRFSLSLKVTLLILCVIVLLVSVAFFGILSMQAVSQNLEREQDLVAAGNSIMAVQSRSGALRRFANGMDTAGEADVKGAVDDVSGQRVALNYLQMQMQALPAGQGDFQRLTQTTESIRELLEQEVTPATAAGDEATLAALSGELNALLDQQEQELVDMGFAVQQAMGDWDFVYSDALADVRWWQLLAAAAAVVAAVGMGLIVARRLKRRISGVSEAVTAMTAGELEQRVELIGNDEITDLARNFNEMAAAMTEHAERLSEEKRRFH